MKRLKEFLCRLNSRDGFWAAAVFIVALAAFLPALGMKEPISDDLFYYLNAQSAQKDLGQIFAPVLGLVTPLTSLSFRLDFLLWGEKHFVTGAHAVNILLHACSMVLFLLLLRRISWKGAFLSPAWAGMTVLIFTLHPQRVESVAWIAERKDCLAMLLGLGALLLFQRALRKEKMPWGSAGLLCLSLLAKPMWIFFFFPAGTLILVEKRRFEWKSFFKLLLPSCCVFLLFVLWQLPIVAQSASKAMTAGEVSLPFKLEMICFNYGSYFIKTFLPGNLYPVYPYYDPAYEFRCLALIPFLLLLTPLLARHEPCRDAVLYAVVPVLACFAVTLVPVVGFSRVGNTDFADRYSYLPSLYLVTMTSFLLRFNLPRESYLSRWLPALGILYCGGLLKQTMDYLPVWRTNLQMVERSMRHPKPNPHIAMGCAAGAVLDGDFRKAVTVCREQLPDSPRYSEDFKRCLLVFKLSAQGLILFRTGRPEEGIRCLNTIYMSPWSGMVCNFPVDFAQKVFTTGAEYHLKRYNDRKAAANLYRRCSTLLKFYAPVYEEFYEGMAALTEENYPEAVRRFRRAHELNPMKGRCLQNLDYALGKLKEKTP